MFLAWYLYLTLYTIHYVYAYLCLTLESQSPHDSLICISVCSSRFGRQVLLWEAERWGHRKRQLWSRTWRPRLAAVQQAVSLTWFPLLTCLQKNKSVCFAFLFKSVVPQLHFVQTFNYSDLRLCCIKKYEGLHFIIFNKISQKRPN